MKFLLRDRFWILLSATISIFIVTYCIFFFKGPTSPVFSATFYDVNDHGQINRSTSRDSDFLKTTSISDTLSSTLDQFIKELEILSDVVENELDSQNHLGFPSFVPLYRLFAGSENYFSNLAKYPNIYTLTLKANIQKLSTILPNINFYNYSSKNCSKVLAPRQEKDSVLKTFYNASCTNDLDMTLNPVDWKWRMHTSVNLGNPPGLTTTSEYLLSYLHVGTYGIIDAIGGVVFQNVTLIQHGCLHFNQKPGYSNKQLARFPVHDKIYVISQFWGENFYHSVQENLPRLSPALAFLKAHPDVKIHVRYHNKNYFSQLGIREDRLVQGFVKAKIVYIPGGVPCGNTPIFQTQLLRLHLLHNIKPAPERKQDVVILIQRSRSNRYFKNHDAILAMLFKATKDAGLTTFEYKDNPLPNFDKTVEMFSRAFIVVAPHGAGAANMIYSQPGAILIEGLCEPKPNFCYGAMSQALGFRYHGVWDDTRSCRDYKPEDFQDVVKYFIDRKQMLK